MSIWAILAIIGIILAACCTVALVVIAAVVVIYLNTRKVYHVDYCGMKEQYKGAKDSYKAGETVRFYYCDTDGGIDYRFYRDGKLLLTDTDPQKGIIISFVMPAHDVKFERRPASD